VSVCWFYCRSEESLPILFRF